MPRGAAVLSRVPAVSVLVKSSDDEKNDVRTWPRRLDILNARYIFVLVSLQRTQQLFLPGQATVGTGHRAILLEMTFPNCLCSWWGPMTKFWLT